MGVEHRRLAAPYDTDGIGVEGQQMFVTDDTGEGVCSSRPGEGPSKLQASERCLAAIEQADL